MRKGGAGDRTVNIAIIAKKSLGEASKVLVLTFPVMQRNSVFFIYFNFDPINLVNTHVFQLLLQFIRQAST